jgi:tRNA (cytidine/uridine-2'-O-)-methyltransferase
MPHVALVEPEIPPNTGNIARLCAATLTPLHIVGVAGFRLDDRAVKRAGLNYWDEVRLFRHRDLEALYQFLPDSRFLYLTTKTDKIYTDFEFRENDCLVFGPETRGLPESLLKANWVRSLNLATSVGIVLFEALRQVGFDPRQTR